MVTGWCVAGLVVLCLLLFGHCYVFLRYRKGCGISNRHTSVIASSSFVNTSPRKPSIHATHSVRPVMHSPSHSTAHDLRPVMHSPRPPGGVGSHHKSPRHQSELGSCR